MNLEGPLKQLTISEIQFGSEYGVDDGDNDLMKSAVFSPKPIITTPILCKYLDRGVMGQFGWRDPPPAFYHDLDDIWTYNRRGLVKLFV